MAECSPSMAQEVWLKVRVRARLIVDALQEIDYKTIASGNPHLRIFAALCVFRLVNALLLQTQFDPDEYWQTLEPAYCATFPTKPCALTWEWTRRAEADDAGLLEGALYGPVRSYVSILPTYVLYQLLKLLHLDYGFFISKGPMLLHAVLVAAVTDYSVYFCASQLSTSTAQWALLCSVTSWFQAYCLVRTYSNSLETVLLMAGLALLTSSSSNSNNNKSKRPALAFWLGGMSVAIRFTSLAAWIPLGYLWSMHQSQQQPSNLHRYLVNTCALFGALGFLTSLLIDRCFYGVWAIPALGNFHFNVVQGLGSLYGAHPVSWYLKACLPAITGTMYPILLWGPNRTFFRLWSLLSVYVLLHSLSAHKELRFLLPILPIFCIIAGRLLSQMLDKAPRVTRRNVMLVFCTINLFPFLYLGMVHQRGSLTINRVIVQRIQQLPAAAGAATTISIDYLMGCHSTPLYSHLHGTAAVATVEARYLDCSPSCRVATPDGGISPCESDVFHDNPTRFMEQLYDGVCLNHRNDVNMTTQVKMCPTYVAMFSDQTSTESSHLLRTMGLIEVDRLFQSIQGAKVLGFALGQVGNTGLSTKTLVPGLVLSVSEIVLYEQQ